MDIEKSLSDGDVSRILACIDAANNVKVLKLTGVVDTGRGLDLVSGSTVIEQIDFSLVDEHESYT